MSPDCPGSEVSSSYLQGTRSHGADVYVNNEPSLVTVIVSILYFKQFVGSRTWAGGFAILTNDKLFTRPRPALQQLYYSGGANAAEPAQFSLKSFEVSN